VTKKETKPSFDERQIVWADKMRETQRRMAWFSLYGMLLYPVTLIILDLLGRKVAIEALVNIAPTYFVSVAAIIAAYYTKEAIIERSK
tara:strand:+ start:368 stop:631 length:264 start_codon:yes stop_codon:yes gene_type:complete